MRAIVLQAYGGPEVLTIKDVPAPLPGPEEVVDSRFPLEDAAAAHRRIEANANFGKIILDVST